MAEREMPWYAVYTKSQKEEYAQVNLRMRGIESFFPKLSLTKSALRKTQRVSLFPNYLFVRFQSFENDYGSVVWCPGVKRIISFAGIPAEIDDSIIGFLMRQVQPDGLIAARSNIKIGQQVTIEGGPFEGLVGIIQEPPNGKGRVKVLLQLMKQATKVDIPVQFIKAGWVPSGETA